jgi:hypothetical protein
LKGSNAQLKLRDEVAVKKDKMKGKKVAGDKLRVLFRNFVCLLITSFYCRQPVASGLSAAWLKAQRCQKMRAIESAHVMGDDMALSTRPDYPPSLEFDREAANAKVATMEAGFSRSTRKNNVYFFTI